MFDTLHSTAVGPVTANRSLDSTHSPLPTSFPFSNPLPTTLYMFSLPSFYPLPSKCSPFPHSTHAALSNCDKHGRSHRLPTRFGPGVVSLLVCSRGARPNAVTGLRGNTYGVFAL